LNSIEAAFTLTLHSLTIAAMMKNKIKYLIIIFSTIYKEGVKGGEEGKSFLGIFLLEYNFFFLEGIYNFF
jgi:hypothetical protein